MYLEWEGGGLAMVTLWHCCVALTDPPTGLQFFLQLTQYPPRPLPEAVSSSNSSEPFLQPGPHQVQAVTTLK